MPLSKLPTNTCASPIGRDVRKINKYAADITVIEAYSNKVGDENIFFKGIVIIGTFLRFDYYLLFRWKIYKIQLG